MAQNIEENNGLPPGYTLHLGDGVRLAQTYDEKNGGGPDGHENQYQENDTDYSSEDQHRRGKHAHEHRQNASDKDWERWEDDVDNGRASKATGDAVYQRRQGQEKIVAAAQNNPQDLIGDGSDCLEHYKDCAGVCWGESVNDNIVTPHREDGKTGCCLEHEKDCAGVCFGDSIWINRNGTQYDAVGTGSSTQGDWKCCSRSQSSMCCQTQMCTGGCPKEGSGGQVVMKDGELCMCDPDEVTGCCSDGAKDCRRRCPYEENYGESCEKYDIFCSNNGNGYECRRHSAGKFITEGDCHWYVGSIKNQGLQITCK